MNWSIEGTSSSTSLDIVLYWESSLVHAGEYLTAEKSGIVVRNEIRCTHSAAVTASLTYALSR